MALFIGRRTDYHKQAEEEPVRTIFIIMDSLNRHYLRCYGGDLAITPNIDRLAERGTVFDNHYAGSLPCMPARREMMTGRVNFLETPWSPIQPWDECLPALMREQRGVYSHMITDHYHYFHAGGEGYNTVFSSWEFQRGQEGDIWRPLVEEPPKPEGARGLEGPCRWGYWRNQTYDPKQRDEDYPTPQCFMRALDFIDRNRETDNWHLHLEVFDPHEPFDCPQKYLEKYGDRWDRYHFTWPLYGRLDPETDDEEVIGHIRNCYGGTLTMADHWLGRLMEKLDEHGMWDDTVVVLTTDHGHMIGERSYWGKQVMPFYNELAHIPLIVCAPGTEGGGRVQTALTTTIDLMPTFMDLHGVPVPEHVQGRSLRHLLDIDEPHHEAVIYGSFARDVCLTDGHYSYFRQAREDSWTHLHTMVPRGGREFHPLERLEVEYGYFLEYPSARGYPQLRWKEPSQKALDSPEFHMLFDLDRDPDQQQPMRDPAREHELATKLRAKLSEFEAPDCQYERLAL